MPDVNLAVSIRRACSVSFSSAVTKASSPIAAIKDNSAKDNSVTAAKLVRVQVNAPIKGN
jgi:hypothetical protein